MAPIASMPAPMVPPRPTHKPSAAGTETLCRLRCTTMHLYLVWLRFYRYACHGNGIRKFRITKWKAKMAKDAITG